MAVLLKIDCWDFPGGSVLKNSPAEAGNEGSSPGPGRCHVPGGQLSPCATAPEARAPRSPAVQERPLQ